jgi:hypothetical protein
MAETEKQRLEIPRGTLLPLVAILGGIVVQYKPLVSERPAAPGDKAVERTTNILATDRVNGRKIIRC